MTLSEALQEVYDRNNNLLTPEIVVEEARDGTDAVSQFLYERFTWDDEEAAERYRLVEARKLIRRVRITYRKSPHHPAVQTRWWVSLPMDRGRSYVPIEEVAENPLLARMALADAEARWRDLKASCGHIAGFFEMIRDDKDLAA